MQNLGSEENEETTLTDSESQIRPKAYVGDFTGTETQTSTTITGVQTLKFRKWPKRLERSIEIILGSIALSLIAGGAYGLVISYFLIPIYLAAGPFVIALFIYDKRQRKPTQSTEQKSMLLPKVLVIVFGLLFCIAIIGTALSPLYYKQHHRDQLDQYHSNLVHDMGFTIYIPSTLENKYPAESNVIDVGRLDRTNSALTGKNEMLVFSRRYHAQNDFHKAYYEITELNKDYLFLINDHCNASYTLDTSISSSPSKNNICKPIDIKLKNGQRITIYYNDRRFYMDIKNTRIIFSIPGDIKSKDILTIQNGLNGSGVVISQNELEAAMAPIIDLAASFKQVDIYSLPLSNSDGNPIHIRR